MADELRLGVKMCGNCNPDIESMEVAGRIAQALGARIVPYGQGQLELTISACVSACVEERYPCPVRIRGLSLNGYPCRDEDELVNTAVRKLREQQASKSLSILE